MVRGMILKKEKRLIHHGVISILVVIGFGLLLDQRLSAQGLSQSDVGKWREDLRFMAAEMPKRHKNLFHTMSRDQFSAAVKKLDEQIPQLSRNQVIVEMARIVAMTGDGHTSLSLASMHGEPSKTNFRKLPIGLYFFKEGLFVEAASSEYRAAVGGRVVNIGNATVERAVEAVKAIVSGDNEMTIKDRVPSYLTMPEVLHSLGIVADMDAIPFIVEKDGKSAKFEIKPAVNEAAVKWVDARAAAKAPTPLWLKDPHNSYWFEYLPDSRTMYVQFNMVLNKPDENITNFFKRVFDEMEKQPIERFVIDLRRNSGGDGFYVWPMVYGLIRSEKINQKGKLFAIIGRRTFSAAKQAVVALERHTNVIFAGEPTGARPNDYGNHDIITLPNSRIEVAVAPFYWQDAMPWDARPWIAPQINIELSAADYQTNNDPILKAVLSYESLTERLTKALSSNDLELAIRRYREFRADPVNVYASTLGEVNSLAERLIGVQKFDQAIELLRLNVEAYPRSWFVHDALGTAYLKSGNTDLAIKNLKRSVELNSSNAGAKQNLKKLGVELESSQP